MSQRIRLFNVEIDVLRMHDAIDQILEWVEQESDVCRFVVTPNVDHTVMLRENHALRRVYDSADLVLADGFPLIVASRLLRKPLPERVAGSELVPKLFASRRRPLRVFLLGAGPGVADRAAAKINAKWPTVSVVGTYSPPFGFERDPQETEEILRRVGQAEPEILVVGFGAPKQEIWIHQHRDRLKAKVALCVGATIDFIAGEKVQAPLWMRRMGLEWIHRVATEPRRLSKRYAKDAWVFPQLVWREWRAASAGNPMSRAVS